MGRKGKPKDTATHSAIKTFLECPRKYQLKYEKMVRGTGRAHALYFGSAWHNILEALRRLIKAEVPVKISVGLLNDYCNVVASQAGLDDVDRLKMRSMLGGYVRRYCRLADVEAPITDVRFKRIIAVEKPFRIPLVNPATGSESRTFDLLGVIDALAEDDDGQLVVVESKTTGDLGSDYMDALWAEWQTKLYMYAAGVVASPVKFWHYDAIEKNKLTWRKSDDEASFVARQKERYTEDRRFLSHKQAWNEEEERETLRMAWHVCQSILESRRRGIFCQNRGSCFLYNRHCEYMSVCRGDTADSEEALAMSGFEIVERKHPEYEEALHSPVQEWLRDQMPMGVLESLENL